MPHNDLEVDLEKCLRDYSINRTNTYQAYVSETVGDVVRILLHTERRSFRMHALDVFVVPAVRLRQLMFIYNVRGVPIGYVVWAYVTDELIDELRMDPGRLLHYDEWNEGVNLLIVDVVAPYGHVRELARAARNKLKRNHRFAWCVARGCRSPALARKRI